MIWRTDSFLFTLLLTISLIIPEWNKVFAQSDAEPLKSAQLESRVNSFPIIAPKEDTLEFAFRVMRFVSKHADTGFLINKFCEAYASYPISNFPINDYLQVFEDNRGTASCGHVAVLMVSILAQNGIPSYNYTFGFPEIGLSHQVVLVKSNAQLSVFDPYLNLTIVGERGEYLSFMDILNHAFDSGFKVRFRSEPVLADLLVDASYLKHTSIETERSPACLELFRRNMIMKDSVIQVKISRSYENDLNNPCSSFILRMENHLRKKTTLTSYHQALLLKFQEISGSDGATEIDRKVNVILRTQGPNWFYVN